ncbi:phosphopantetheine-binding protein, partial [Chamaesiphon sp. OTE_75_metabat_556]|uniref:phosphopantetheine-binding protein n=1 Tax=Chamaesiphon sp. OTE_75_metabat_556 TaxID=2964692 RepID=UPI00286BF79A
LKNLPLTLNGKIDRQALPAPNFKGYSTEIELPITATEKTLSQIWAKLLKYGAIARTDNFFDLGGHSLLATQLIARIRDNFKIELPLRQIFESPTLDRLATYLDTCMWINSATADLQSLNSEEEEFEL